MMLSRVIRMRPGTMVARKQASTDCPVTQAYMI